MDLLKSFNDREIADIDEQVSRQKRKSLQLLYSTIKKYRKKTGIPENEELFEKAFNKSYSSGQNYLLRNELRLLNELIYDYMIGETFQSYLKKHKSTFYQWLARSFFDRKIKSAFEGDIDRFIDYSKEDINPIDTANMYDLKSLWLVYNQEKKVENIRGQIALMEDWKKEEIRRLKYRLREMEARQAYLELVLHAQSGDTERPADVRTPPLTQIDLGNYSDSDWFERYVILKKHSYQSKGKIRIEVLKLMLEIEEAPYYIGEYSTFNAQISTLNNMALEYILLGDFTAAENYLETAFSRCETNNHPVVISNVQNYLAIQMPLKQYQKGIEIFTKYEEQILPSRSVNTISIYRSYCYLFLHRADEALSLLPESAQFSRHDQLFYRMAYAIAFCIRGQIDLALNECRNIRKLINGTETSSETPGSAYDERYLWVIRLFTQFLKALEKDKERKQAELQKLKDELWINPEETEALLRTEFPLLWLWREVEQHLATDSGAGIKVPGV